MLTPSPDQVQNIHMKEVGTGIWAVCLELQELQGNGETAADGGQRWGGQEGLEQNGI